MYPLTDERHVRRAQRSEDESFGLVTRTRGGPAVVSPREPSHCSILIGAGQQRQRLAIGRDFVVEMRGLEPLTPSLQRRCSPS